MGLVAAGNRWYHDTAVTETIEAAYPLLMRARLLDAVSAAQAANGRDPVTAERARRHDQITRSPRAFSELARKVAECGADEAGRELVPAGRDRRGVRLWVVSQPAAPTAPATATSAPPAPPAADPRAERLAELATALALPGDADPVATILRVLESQVAPAPPAEPAPLPSFVQPTRVSRFGSDGSDLVVAPAPPAPSTEPAPTVAPTSPTPFDAASEPAPPTTPAPARRSPAVEALLAKRRQASAAQTDPNKP